MDIYGQKLEQETTKTFDVAAPTEASLSVARPLTYSRENHIISLDPSLPPILYLSSSNVTSIRVNAYHFNPVNHHKEFSDYHVSPDKKIPNFLQETWKGTFEVVARTNESNEKQWYLETHTAVDLSKAFKCDASSKCQNAGVSQLVLLVEAYDTIAVLKAPLLLKLWLSWTEIGISYIADEDNIYG